MWLVSESKTSRPDGVSSKCHPGFSSFYLSPKIKIKPRLLANVLKKNGYVMKKRRMFDQSFAIFLSCVHSFLCNSVGMFFFWKNGANRIYFMFWKM
uniref:Uncharacterized protein n=1 Tax=Arundo donax TaxID=35708 RepID=A0A0A9FGD2_ARUDO